MEVINYGSREMELAVLLVAERRGAEEHRKLVQKKLNLERELSKLWVRSWHKLMRQE